MSAATRKYSNEEIMRRGDEIYETKIRPKLRKRDIDRIIAIDVESGEFEFGDNEIEAHRKLTARKPDASTWFVRAGHDYVHSFGGRKFAGLQE